jgi:DNA-binding response OmpR family regulator
VKSDCPPERIKIMSKVLVIAHIYRLRQKVDDGFSHPLICTVPGAGYTMRQPEVELV